MGIEKTVFGREDTVRERLSTKQCRRRRLSSLLKVRGDEHEVRETLLASDDFGSDYFEKFFPVSVTVATPDPKMLGLLFQRHIVAAAAKGNWFLGTEEKKF